MEPVVDGAIHRCAQIELRAQGVQLEPNVNVLGRESSLVNMKGMSALVGRHQCVPYWIETNSSWPDPDLD